MPEQTCSREVMRHVRVMSNILQLLTTTLRSLQCEAATNILLSAAQESYEMEGLMHRTRVPIIADVRSSSERMQVRLDVYYYIKALTKDTDNCYDL